VERHIAMHAAVAVDVEVAAVAGARTGVDDPLAIGAGGGQVGQLGAVDDHQVDRCRVTLLQPVDVGQQVLVDLQGRLGGHAADASIATALFPVLPCLVIAFFPSVSRAARTRPRGPRWLTWRRAWAGPASVPTTPTWTPAAKSVKW